MCFLKGNWEDIQEEYVHGWNLTIKWGFGKSKFTTVQEYSRVLSRYSFEIITKNSQFMQLTCARNADHRGVYTIYVTNWNALEMLTI